MTGTRTLFLCLVSVVTSYPASGLERLVPKCDENDLVVYKLIFETHWTKENFPKQYPENRPPAHWSRLIGMSHNENYQLFRMGETASKEFKLFAETGKTYLFGKNHDRDILDEFFTSSIKNGTGMTYVDFFADGNHSLVSMAAKIIPSPDWFVGVDSLALCAEGTWLDSITIEASPMDAGTDSGYTFTAPNWETEPQEIIKKITSKYPKHPANSFYYPKLQDLPVIATFHIVKKKSYQLRRRMETSRIAEESAAKTPVLNVTKEGEGLNWSQEEQSPRKDFTGGKLVRFKKFHKKRKLKKQHHLNSDVFE